MSEQTFTPNLYAYEFDVPSSAIDANGHVNNVEFVRWMQDAAIAHADARGCTAATREAGAMWVVRTHQIKYRRPAFTGERVRVVTWLANCRRSCSLRRYRFERVSDGEVLAEGETDWVFLEVASGRPKHVPPAIIALFATEQEQEEIARLERHKEAVVPGCAGATGRGTPRPVPAL